MTRIMAMVRCENGCWVWTKALTRTGYARTTIAGRATLVHRYVYEQMIEPIPEDLTLDHLCRVRSCVNPVHMEPVTSTENTARGLGGVLRTTCIQGHLLTPDNVRIEPPNRRRCLTCEADRNVRRKAARALKAGSPGHVGGAAVNAEKTRCPLGHEYTEDNTYVSRNGGRSCKECRRRKSREWYARTRRAQFQGAGGTRT